MLFKIHAERNSTDTKTFLYDNETNTLSTEDGFIFEDPRIEAKWEPATIFSKEQPLSKSRRVTTLKIQVGLSCNYGCSYCSQRFVERADETSHKHVDTFMQRLSNLDFDEQSGLKIEIWGGEPLVYIKTIKPLVAALNKKFSSWLKKPRFSMITNGSLLTEETCDWLYANHFSVAISHDGPAQHVRGPDPFDDPELKKTILRFYHMMRPINRISFNSMLNRNNMSRREVYQWFVNLTGDPSVILGEGGIIDAYDDDGLANSLNTKDEHFQYRRTAFNDIFSTNGGIGNYGILEKIDAFGRAVLSHRPSEALAQKCGMDDEHTLAVDLRGNIITCQNVSAVATAGNGMSHLAGNITDIEAAKIHTGTHWSNRPDCASCPVLHICQGACLYLEGEYWDKSCNNSYSDAIPLFALSIEKITGYIPTFIDADHLPPERRDIWGTILDHEEATTSSTASKKFVQQTTIVEGIEVFSQAEIIDAALAHGK
ncbi:AslB Arylsulfatase regulator (Fe-S oxidoreductase) [uncultured Caudovirales phage]|uniref:AslB Arylsulfatase regulator (Fe-S oxidoreductase) n=1 Tax=uncultured Caudovirales phage TaxID=2100421 RepID=A0A6J7WQA3_9CAUD|nr:AslB Arylsulfatase regulator (Fe-S oxidoreductase) [uncultured Caudovirales phage]